MFWKCLEYGKCSISNGQCDSIYAWFDHLLCPSSLPSLRLRPGSVWMSGWTWYHITHSCWWCDCSLFWKSAASFKQEKRRKKRDTGTWSTFVLGDGQLVDLKTYSPALVSSYTFQRMMNGGKQMNRLARSKNLTSFRSDSAQSLWCSNCL